LSTTRLALTLVSAVALAVALHGEKHDRWTQVRLSKPVASLGFLGVALTGEVYGNAFHVAIFTALVFSFFGDVFLMWRSRPLFLSGLLSFLLGHVGFAAAFVLGGVDALWFAAGAGVMLVLGLVVGRWILRHVEDTMRGPVLAYITIISLMVALAVGHYGVNGLLAVPLGALAFYGSDLSVARDRFLGAGFSNRLWGLPLYYAAQFTFAFTVALAGQ
jgi:uncharacterized membrane protein YhhN